MSHPAASVKSIFSGKVNFDSMDDFDMNSNADYDSDPEDSLSRLSGDSGNSITSRNLRNLTETLGPQRALKDIDNSFSNYSAGSGESEYQHTSERGVDQLGLDLLQPDPFSRPLSRNSTISCLSTTATKDGVEGRRFHRYGPTTYSSNIIANMMHQQAEKPDEVLSASEGERPLSPGLSDLRKVKVSSTYTKSGLLQAANKPTLLDSISPEQNYSEVSIKSTLAEFDGDSGLEQEKRKTVVEKSLPAGYWEPPTLREKMELLEEQRN